MFTQIFLFNLLIAFSIMFCAYLIVTCIRFSFGSAPRVASGLCNKKVWYGQNEDKRTRGARGVEKWEFWTNVLFDCPLTNKYKTIFL